MLPINPKDVSITFRLISVALASGLLTKEEVIDWADNIVTTSDKPDIYFIELAMFSTKNTKQLLQHVNAYHPAFTGKLPVRPMLSLLYKRYQKGAFTMAQTIAKLFEWIFENQFSPLEETRIYVLEHSYGDARDNIYGSMQDVKTALNSFLNLYKDYSFDNIEQWPALDKIVEEAL